MNFKVLFQWYIRLMSQVLQSTCETGQIALSLVEGDPGLTARAALLRRQTHLQEVDRHLVAACRAAGRGVYLGARAGDQGVGAGAGSGGLQVQGLEGEVRACSGCGEYLGAQQVLAGAVRIPAARALALQHVI